MRGRRRPDSLFAIGQDASKAFATDDSMNFQEEKSYVQTTTASSNRFDAFDNLAAKTVDDPTQISSYLRSRHARAPNMSQTAGSVEVKNLQLEQHGFSAEVSASDPMYLFVFYLESLQLREPTLSDVSFSFRLNWIVDSGRFSSSLFDFDGNLTGPSLEVDWFAYLEASLPVQTDKSNVHLCLTYNNTEENLALGSLNLTTIGVSDVFQRFNIDLFTTSGVFATITAFAASQPRWVLLGRELFERKIDSRATAVANWLDVDSDHQARYLEQFVGNELRGGGEDSQRSEALYGLHRISEALEEDLNESRFSVGEKLDSEKLVGLKLKQNKSGVEVSPEPEWNKMSNSFKSSPQYERKMELKSDFEFEFHQSAEPTQHLESSSSFRNEEVLDHSLSIETLQPSPTRMELPRQTAKRNDKKQKEKKEEKEAMNTKMSDPLFFRPTSPSSAASDHIKAEPGRRNPPLGSINSRTSQQDPLQDRSGRQSHRSVAEKETSNGMNEDEMNEDEMNEDEMNEDEMNEDEMNEDSQQAQVFGTLLGVCGELQKSVELLKEGDKKGKTSERVKSSSVSTPSESDLILLRKTLKLCVSLCQRVANPKSQSMYIPTLQGLLTDVDTLCQDDSTATSPVNNKIQTPSLSPQLRRPSVRMSTKVSPEIPCKSREKPFIEFHKATQATHAGQRLIEGQPSEASSLQPSPQMNSQLRRTFDATLHRVPRTKCPTSTSERVNKRHAEQSRDCPAEQKFRDIEKRQITSTKSNASSDDMEPTQVQESPTAWIDKQRQAPIRRQSFHDSRMQRRPRSTYSSASNISIPVHPLQDPPRPSPPTSCASPMRGFTKSTMPSFHLPPLIWNTQKLI